MCLALALATSAPRAALAQSPPKVRVDFIAVGQGDAALVTSPSGKTVLIDAGPPESAERLLSFLASRRCQALDLVLLTHRHADHLGGARRLVEALPVKMFMDATFPHPTPLYRALLEALAAHKVPVRLATRGRKIDLGEGAVLELLGPPEPPLSGTRSDVNANSVVARLDFGGSAVLFAADAEAATEAWLLSTRARLRADVLKVAHHGGRYSSKPDFLKAVGPSVAVVSVGPGNRYRHPAPATIARLQKLGARVLRTDQDGDVTIESDGKAWTVRTSLSPLASSAPASAPSP